MNHGQSEPRIIIAGAGLVGSLLAIYLSRRGYRVDVYDRNPAATADWVAEKNVLHMWPRDRYMLLGFPHTDGSFTCSLHMPFEGNVSFASVQTESDVIDFFYEKLPDVIDHIPNPVQEFNRCPPNPMVTVRCSPWTFARPISASTQTLVRRTRTC